MRGPANKLVLSVLVLLASPPPWSVARGAESRNPPALHMKKPASPMTTKNSTTTQKLLARYDRLPDLRALAQVSGKELYAEQERLVREHAAQKKPYRLSMPYRSPGSPCRSGGHHLPRVKHTLVDPAHAATVELWEADLHEAQAHGAPLPADVAGFLERLKDAMAPAPAADAGAHDPRTQRVDRALREHGNFGVYGDVRAGLLELSKACDVKLTDVPGGVRVDAVPRDGHGHEYQFIVTPTGTIEDLIVGESLPRPVPPRSLVFQFDNLRLVKQGSIINLTIEPVWQDAQLAPPPGFELGKRSYSMNAEEFGSVWAELNAIDFARYARVTDADFEQTPPDLRHTERLLYSVNGQEMVSWGRGYQWLKKELRAPLLQIQRQLTTWADEQPAPAPGAFQRIMLRDVEGLNGGQNVYVYSDGKLLVQRVLPAQGEGGLQEQRYEWKLDANQLAELKKMLAQHPPRPLGFSRPGIPGETQVEIDILGETGTHIVMRQWARDAQVDFGALYNHLLRFARAAEKRKPVRDGKYDDAWRPEGG